MKKDPYTIEVKNSGQLYGVYPPSYNCPHCDNPNTHLCANQIPKNGRFDGLLLNFWAECGHQWLLHVWTAKGETFFEHLPLNTLEETKQVLSSEFGVIDYSR